jgi:hypothetical protein
MWKVIVDSLLAIIPAILKPKKKDQSYEQLLKETNKEIKADIIRLKDRKRTLRAELMQKSKTRVKK